MYSLPRTAIAPFCPAEVRGSVVVDPNARPLAKLARFVGPGLLVSVGCMDPGNWATDIAAGSQFGHGLLFVVLLASLAAMLLQTMCVRLGLVAGKDLARACRERCGPRARRRSWLGAEIAIVACDLASDRRVMGEFANGPVIAVCAWVLFAVIVLANAWLVVLALR